MTHRVGPGASWEPCRAARGRSLFFPGGEKCFYSWEKNRFIWIEGIKDMNSINDIKSLKVIKVIKIFKVIKVIKVIRYGDYTGYRVIRL